MPLKIENSWHEHLKEEFGKSYYKELMEFVEGEYHTETCYPPYNQVFSAFAHTPFDDVKVVIIGQDPYHGPGQANGLCFSVSNRIPVPPSLKNIYKEIASDLGTETTTSGNLAAWAKQGVLLLNATLTVRAGQAGSHQRKGWEQFTDVIIDKLSSERENIVFLLWGGYAKKKGRKIDSQKHCVLTSGHPSPLSANKGHWFENAHFSKTNAFLDSIGESPIIW